MRYLFLLLLLLASPLQAKQSVCLNMIVKDESAVIKRCLDSVRPFIDYWVIVDTGSTDGTQQIVKEHLKDIPGELHEEPWVNFGYNRTQAIEFAKGKADYLLIMDADDWLDYEKDYMLPPLTKDAYQFTRGNKHFSYLTIQLVKSTLPWRWVGALHEYLTPDCPYQMETLKNISYVQTVEGSRSEDPDKYWKHVKILEKALKDEPNNPRHVFYLAESFRDAGDLESAITWYQNHVDMGGWEEEVYWSLLQIGKLKKELREDSEKIIEAFYRAHRFRPHRAEAVYYLAEYYNQLGRHDLAYACIRSREFVKPGRDILFNENWVEDWGLNFQLSIASYYVGHYQESLDLCDQLLETPFIPENVRCQAKLNRFYPLEKEAYNKKILLAILARNKAHVLPTFLTCIENLDYDKNLITVYVHTNNNEDNTKEILETWISKNKHLYSEIVFEPEEIPNLPSTNPHQWTPKRWNVLGEIRNKSLQKTKEYDCDYYFVVDCDNFIVPETLKELLIKNKPIVAPLLSSLTDVNPQYSNFFADVDPNGYFKQSPEFFKILYRDQIGTFKVPVVHHVYLVKSEVIDSLSYTDDSNEWEFIIFSRSARKHGADQYICNERDFGSFLHFSKDVSLKEETDYFAKFNPSKLKPDLLIGRIRPDDKRYNTMKRALQLMNERDVKTIVETGTARGGNDNFDGDGGSTVLFADWANLHEAKLYSVDIDSNAIFQATFATLPYRDAVQLIHSDSIQFLEKFPEKIDFLYLDSFDFDYSNPTLSQVHHLREIEAAYDKLAHDAIVMIDDCKLPHGGKGKLVLEFLADREWQIIADEYQVILTKSATSSQEENFIELLQHAKLQENKKKPQQTVIDSYRKACHYAGLHIEPHFYLSNYYRKLGRYAEAYQTAKEGCAILSSKYNSIPLEKWIYEYGMYWELSLCAHSQGNFEEAILISEQLLESAFLVSDQKAQLNKNISYYRAGIQVRNFAHNNWGEKLSDRSPKLHLCTIATKELPELHQLINSCKANAITPTVLGKDQPFTFGAKLRFVREYLEHVPDHDVILVIDAYDTLVLSDEETILQKFYAMNTPFVISTEVGCHPFPHYANHYPKSPTRFKYLNAGSYIGYAGYVKYLLDSLSPIDDETDDQGLLSALYLYQPYTMKLDYTGDLFLTLYQVDLNQIIIEDQRVRSLETNASPCVIHGNGSGKWLYQYIYDHTFSHSR